MLRRYWTSPNACFGPSEFIFARPFGPSALTVILTVQATHLLSPVPEARLRQPIERTVFFAKIIKIRSHVHRGARCTLDEIVRHELAAMPVKTVAQPGAQRLKFALADFARDLWVRLDRGRIKLSHRI